MIIEFEFDYLDVHGKKYTMKGKHKFVVAKHFRIGKKDDDELDRNAKRFVMFLRAHTSSYFYQKMLIEANRMKLLEAL